MLSRRNFSPVPEGTVVCAVHLEPRRNDAAAGFVAYKNGVAQLGSTYTLNANSGTITWNTAPANGVVLTYDAPTFYYRVRFVETTYDFNLFQYRLWELQSLTLISVASSSFINTPAILQPGFVTGNMIAGQIPIATSTTTATWQFPPDANWLNVLNFGAKGDGVTDDTAAIQATFNSVTAQKNIVYFPNPASFYKITAPITD